MTCLKNKNKMCKYNMEVYIYRKIYKNYRSYCDLCTILSYFISQRKMKIENVFWSFTQGSNSL